MLVKLIACISLERKKIFYVYSKECSQEKMKKCASSASPPPEDNIIQCLEFMTNLLLIMAKFLVTETYAFHFISLHEISICLT